MPTLELDGAAIAYDDTVEGSDPVVFSHGFLFSRRMFAPQIAHLRRRHRCIAYDHRGQGESGDGAPGYDLRTLTADAAQLVERLGAAPCHFVGLSMGGFVGLRLAAERPDLVRSLTLISSAADAEPRLNVPKYRAMALVMRLLGPRPLLAPIERIVLGRAFRADPARAAERRAIDATLLALDVRRTRAALEVVVARPSHLDVAARVRAPVLVLHGQGDRAIAMGRARRTAAALRDAELVELPRAGHTATLEEPALVSAALERFLARASGRG